MKLLTEEQQESCVNPEINCICQKKLENKYVKRKKYRKVRDRKQRCSACLIQNLVCLKKLR